jgi:hypothetical protein
MEEQVISRERVKPMTADAAAAPDDGVFSEQ